MFKFHLIALLFGTILELYFGDLKAFCWIKNAIIRSSKILESTFLGEDYVLLEKTDRKDYGLALLLMVLVPMVFLIGILNFVFYNINAFCGVVFESYIVICCLEVRKLRVDFLSFKEAYFDKNICLDKYDFSWVSKDYKKYSIEELTKKVVEQVAISLNRGFIGPLFYLFIGGPALGVLYFGISILDNEVGYHTERYEDFGYYAAKLDDAANYIPSRIAGRLTILGTKISTGSYNSKNSSYIFHRDRRNNLSPNSGMTEAALAGALEISLGDDVSFNTSSNRPKIGDATREIDINVANKAVELLYFLYFTIQIILVILLIIF